MGPRFFMKSQVGICLVALPNPPTRTVSGSDGGRIT